MSDRMTIRRRTTWLMVGMCALLLSMAAAQQDEGPILKPKVKPKPAGATLLVMCDLACDWKLDGEAKGRIDAGGAAKVKVELGQHVVVAVTEDGADKVEQLSEVKSTGQTVASVKLQPIRDARLKAEQDLRDRAGREQQAREQKEAGAKSAVILATEQYKNGRLYYDQQRYQEAKPLFQSACDGGNMDGCSDLGLLYMAGWGVAKDYDQARTLYQKACGIGNLKGCNGLGNLFDSGFGVAQDFQQARTLFQKACNGGFPTACGNLAWLYEAGRGVAQDYTQARGLAKMACDGGAYMGCFSLATYYAKGQGGLQDYSQALGLYKEACDGSGFAGCIELAGLYANGHGGPQDYSKARIYYKKSCDRGNKAACDALSKLP